MVAIHQPWSLVHQAQQWIKPVLYEGALAIDATVGNGHDTLFLAQQVGKIGLVYGFDLQETALVATRSRLQQVGQFDQVRLFLQSHAVMAEYIPSLQHGQIAAIMFNLGYLPGSNKQLITQSDSTLAALNGAVNLLMQGGRLSVLAYPGHVGGDRETRVVQAWCAMLATEHFSWDIHYGRVPSDTAPRLLAITKRAG